LQTSVSENASLKHGYQKTLKQRVLFLIHRYEDANNTGNLKYDTAFKTILNGDVVSKPPVSRFENDMDKYHCP
jgi:hypothetical protein